MRLGQFLLSSLELNEEAGVSREAGSDVSLSQRDRYSQEEHSSVGEPIPMLCVFERQQRGPMTKEPPDAEDA
ncbi:hypothetical protein PBY51_018210 [Eleginops maclovinus]|uniref:Uncharacterized protein n=1 Tax=Eleginops maclovinus TaxID=56733 RepID=A0AAN7XN83_ELEMC|nr:hypothetical protein PBY51_018210 [Eleginops maclovinus]